MSLIDCSSREMSGHQSLLKASLFIALAILQTEYFVYCRGRFDSAAAIVKVRYVLVQDLRPGDWFGIMGYFGDGTRPQDSNALEPSQLAFLKGTYLDEVLDAYPQVYRSILHQMASYSTDFFSRYFSAVNLSLRSRIAQMLLKIAQWQSVLDLNITQTDLASLLGVTREAVGGHLNELQKIGAIELGYKKIILLNPELLSEQM